MTGTLQERILRVDLTTGQMHTESAAPYTDYIGGIGVGEKILCDEVMPETDAFDPENLLIICTGALSGTCCPGSGRIAAVTKSPVTGGIASGNAGGAFAPHMRYAGFDYIVLEGRAPELSYLMLRDGKAELLPADQLKGLPVSKAVDWLEQQHGGDGRTISTFCIGPAAERLVRFGCVTVDRHRVIGKCGFGAVMGSKNLKAVVADGTTGCVQVSDPMGLMCKIDEIYERMAEKKVYKALADYGTLNAIPGKVAVGGFNYKHHQNLIMPDEMVETYKPENIVSKYRIRQTSCGGCMLGCQNGHRIPDSEYKGTEMEGAPFNSVLNFGTKLGINDYGFCIEATRLCNDLGMDMDSVSEILGWTMECCEKGLLDAEDLDGLNMQFGDAKAAHTMILKIAERDGIGKLLGEGVARAAEQFSEQAAYLAIHQKGNDLYELMRPLIGYALGAATSTRGGSHVLGSPVLESAAFDEEEKKTARAKYGVDTFDKPAAYEGKPEIVTYYESISRACSSMGLCMFVSDWQQVQMLDHDDLAQLLELAGGLSLTGEELRERMLALVDLEKVFNYLHAGFTRKDDIPRDRLFDEAAPDGPAKGAVLDREKWDAMLDHYYELHGWDVETGLPTAESLRRHGLEKLIDLVDRGQPA